MCLMYAKVFFTWFRFKLWLFSSKHKIKCVFLDKTTHNKGDRLSGKFKQQKNIMLALTVVAEVKEKYWIKNKIKESLSKKKKK